MSLCCFCFSVNVQARQMKRTSISEQVRESAAQQLGEQVVVLVLVLMRMLMLEKQEYDLVLNCREGGIGGLQTRIFSLVEKLTHTNV